MNVLQHHRLSSDFCIFVISQKQKTMTTQEIYIIEPSTHEEANALKAFAKALKLKLRIQQGNTSLNSIRKGMREVKMMEDGKQKATFAKDFLNEL